MLLWLYGEVLEVVWQPLALHGSQNMGMHSSLQQLHGCVTACWLHLGVCH